MVELKKAPFYLSQEDISWVERTIGAMTEEEKLGQLFCPIALSDEEGYLARFTDMGVGGVLFRAGAPEAVLKAHTALQQSSKVPLLLAANLETGGDGIALGGTSYACHMEVAATEDVSRAYELGRIAGAEGAAVGLNWAFGPVVDIDMNYRNPITNVRTFGSDAQRVLRMGLETDRGLREQGLATAIKHFPGDGVDDRDQHLVTSVNSLDKESWLATFGRIYKGMIEADVLSVMAGHIMLPAYQKQPLPATLSSELLQGLLRRELGFNGLIVTDATPMAGFCSAMERARAVPYSIEAGCDMFLFNRDLEEDFEYMRQGVAQGILSQERLHDALRRVLALKAALGLNKKQKNRLTPPPQGLKVIGCGEHLKAARECANKAATLVKDGGALPLTPEKYPRVLLEVLGDYPSTPRVRATVKDRLEKEGFAVTVYAPENFQTLDVSVESFKKKYDLVLYVANLENVSNQTVSRIQWHTFFGMGNNLPWFVKEKPTVFVSAGNPYLMQDAPMADTFVNAYINSDIMLHCVIDKLMGLSPFEGGSPVDPFCGRADLRL